MSAKRTFSLSKNKESEKYKTQSDFYSFESQVAKFRSQAESRVWKISFDSELLGLALIENSQQETEIILYDKRCLQCSCLDFLTQEINSCIHVEALKRLWRETKHEDLSWIKSVFGYSQINLLCYDSVKCEFFPSFRSSPEFIINCSRAGLKLEKEKFVLIDPKSLFLAINNLQIQTSPTFRHLFPHLEKEFNKPQQIIPSREIIKNLINDKLSLFEYQYEAVQFLGQAERGILALPMGYGKTLIAILASHLLDLKRILVISPATIKNYWQTEYEKFTGRKFEVWDAKQDISNSAEQVIISYELLQRNIDSIQKDWDLVIVDEVQRIRNDESKVWAAVNQLSSRYAFALSGTVIENGIQDLLAIVRWLYPKYFSPKWKFYSKHCKTEGPKVLGLQNSEELQKFLSTFLFRAPETLSDVKLPDIKHRVVSVKLSIQQANYHDTYYQQAKILLSKSFQKPLTFGERTKLNALLLKSRQACNSAKLISPNSKEVGQKYPEAFKLIQKIIDKKEKIVVYSEWIESLALLEELLIKEKIDYLKLIGKVKSNKRLKLVEEFITNSNKKLFLSTDAGGYGLDGLQLAANNVIHLELPWNPGKLDQRNGRLQRLLQKATEVQAYYFVAENSIEEMVQKSNERKRQIRFQVLG